MDYERDEQVIYFKDLVFVALYQWRRILIFAVIFALLLGGFMGISAIKERSASVDTITEEQAAYEQELQLYNLQKAAIASKKEILNNTLTGLQEAAENSPFAEDEDLPLYTAYALYTATTSQPYASSQAMVRDHTHTVMQSYNTLLAGKTAADLLADALDFDTRYRSEVLSTTYNGDARTLRIAVTYTSAEKAREGLALLQEFLSSSQATVQKATVDHTLNLIVEDLQTVTTEQRKADRIQREKEQQDLIDQLLQLEEDEKEMIEPIAPAPAIETNVITKAILFAIIGAVLGCFLVAGCSWLYHLTGTRVYSKRTLQGRTHIETIAVMDSLLGNAIDHRLRKWEGRTVGQESRDVCCSLVKQYCANNSKVQLLYCGTQAQADLEKALAGNVLCAEAGTVEAIEQLTECDGVVLVAQCHVSRYDVLKQQAKQIIDLNKKIIGCVLIDG